MNKARSMFRMFGTSVLVVGGLLALAGMSSAQEADFTEEFRIEECDFSTTGRNPYFILEPGYRLTLTGEEDGEELVLEITVLDETEVVDGVLTRVVEERETTDGVIAEISRNFFAICTKTNSVFYFGEDVDIYDDEGNLESHEGAWRAGVDGAQAGVMMPGTILVGSKYYQEIALDVAMDRAENLSITEDVSTPFGDLENCLKIEETTPVEPDAIDYKYYAPGVGIVQDGDLLLSEVEGLQVLDLEPFEQESNFTEYFMLETCEFSNTGRNPYFILEPGYRLVFEGEEDGEEILLTITVLDETEMVDGVETRIIEEREWVDDVLIEVSRNFFAICTRTNSVFYFGEDVDIYDDEGNLESHDGAWRAGVDGARAGLMISGMPLIGSRYSQEVAPDIAMDRAEDLSLTEVVSTPAGTFENCLLVKETTPIEPDVEEYKLYAPGIGLVQEGDLQLTEYEGHSSVENWELMR
ncbi:MAG: hypothetical protein ABIH23_27530 [bacterium]